MRAASLALSLLLLLLLPGWILVNSVDAPRVADEDLELPHHPLPEEQNGFGHLEAAAALVDWPQEEGVAGLHRGEGAFETQAPLLVERNRAALDRARRALRAPHFQLPAYEDSANRLPDTLRWQRLAELLCIQGWLAAGRGEAEEALPFFEEAVALGHRIEGARGGGLVYAMVGVAMRRLSLEAFRRWALEVPLERDTARATASRLASLRSDPEAWRRVWAAEYQGMKQSLLQGMATSAHRAPDLGLIGQEPRWYHHLIPRFYLFQPKRTLNRFAAYFRALGEASALPCAEPRRFPDPLPRDGAGSLRLLARPNAVGEILYSIALPNFPRFEHQRCRADTLVGAVQLSLALGAFENERGRLPEHLGALVPDYLEALPLDAFDGRPLRYSRESRVLWSIGADLVDRGGAPEDADSLDEPTFPLGRSEASSQPPVP